MSNENDNKAIVGRWFDKFWGKICDLSIVDEIAAPDMLLKYSLHEPRRGHADIKAFMTDFRRAFPDLCFWGTRGSYRRGAITSSDIGTVEALIPAPRSVTSFGDRCRQTLLGKCDSPESRFSRSLTEKSLKRSGWTTVSRLSRSSASCGMFNEP